MTTRDDEITIDFGAGGNSAEFCRAGWSQPEPRHTWTIGPESALELPRPAEPGDFWLTIELGPFVYKDILPAQHLSVFVNEVEVGAFEVRETTSIACRAEWAILAAQPKVAIRFAHPDAAKPSAVSGVPDHREMALAFERLHFHRAAATEGAANAGQIAASIESAALAALPLDQLMMRFESLGENCEFGLAQRRCGAEPIGLLRFASAQLPNLLAGLKNRFEGMGEADQVEVRPSPDGKEYLVIDRRYGFLYHPWVLVGEAEAEDVRQREMKRLPFLRRKMLEDLTEGRKIFVYHGMQPLAEPAVKRLVTEIRAYGPGTLLWVELEDEANPAGSVKAVMPGLLKGHIDRFAPGEDAHDFSLESWITLCRNVFMQ